MELLDPLDIPAGERVFVVEKDAERVYRENGRLVRRQMRTAVLVGVDGYRVVTLGPPTGEAARCFFAEGGLEWARYRDLSAWRSEVGLREKESDPEVTAQWHQTIADTAEQLVAAEQARSQFGPGGHVQRE